MIRSSVFFYDSSVRKSPTSLFADPSLASSIDSRIANESVTCAYCSSQASYDAMFTLVTRSGSSSSDSCSTLYFTERLRGIMDVGFSDVLGSDASGFFCCVSALKLRTPCFDG
jgi:hypothetical protein